jgi:hypothetical protein
MLRKTENVICNYVTYIFATFATPGSRASLEDKDLTGTPKILFSVLHTNSRFNIILGSKINVL